MSMASRIDRNYEFLRSFSRPRPFTARERQKVLKTLSVDRLEAIAECIYNISIQTDWGPSPRVRKAFKATEDGKALVAVQPVLTFLKRYRVNSSVPKNKKLKLNKLLAMVVKHHDAVFKVVNLAVGKIIIASVCEVCNGED